MLRYAAVCELIHPTKCVEYILFQPFFENLYNDNILMRLRHPVIGEVIFVKIILKIAK